MWKVFSQKIETESRFLNYIKRETMLEEKNVIINKAEKALRSIGDWRIRERSRVPGETDIVRELTNLSLLPPLHLESLQEAVRVTIDSEGEVPLALHAISCLNFIGGGNKSHIATITGKSKRWKC